MFTGTDELFRVSEVNHVKFVNPGRRKKKNASSQRRSGKPKPKSRRKRRPNKGSEPTADHPPIKHARSTSVKNHKEVHDRAVSRVVMPCASPLITEFAATELTSMVKYIGLTPTRSYSCILPLHARVSYSLCMLVFPTPIA